MTPDWRSIGRVPQAWRDSLIVQVESGIVQTRAKRVVQHLYDPAQLHAACARIIQRIRTEVRYSPFGWRTDEPVNYLPCYDNAIQLRDYKTALATIVGPLTILDERLVGRCLEVQSEEFYGIAINAVDLDGGGVVTGQFVNSVHGRIDWNAASSMWRCGIRNNEGKRIGYDALGIEFDYTAANPLGCLLEPSEIRSATRSRGRPAK